VVRPSSATDYKQYLPLYGTMNDRGARRPPHRVLGSVGVLAFLADFAARMRKRDRHGHNQDPIGVSLQLAVTAVSSSVIASVAFALLLVSFRPSRIDFWGVVLCVLMRDLDLFLHHRRGPS